MTNLPTQIQKCIILRNGSEIWIPAVKAEQLEQACISGERCFVKLKDAGDRTINTADIVEFLTAEQMNDRARLKAGEYKCSFGNWHDKKKICDCKNIAHKKYMELVCKKQEEKVMREKTSEERDSIKLTLDEMRQKLANKFGMKFKMAIKKKG